MTLNTTSGTVTSLDDVRALKAELKAQSPDWMAVKEIRDKVELLASEDAEGMEDFLRMEKGAELHLSVEITDPDVAQAVLQSISSQAISLIPGLKIKTIKLNPNKE